MTLDPTSHPVEGYIPIHVPAPPSPTFCPDYSASTSPCVVIPTPALACPAPSSPAPQKSTSALPNNVYFGQLIKESLPYVDVAQSPYPSPAAPSSYDLAETYKATTEEIHRAPFFLAFIALRQRGTLGTLLAAVLHLTAALLNTM